MKKIPAFLIILAVAFSCKKGGNGNGSIITGADIFPNKVGDTWVYNVEDTAYISSAVPVISSYSMTVSVIDSIQLSGTGWVKRWVYSYPGGSDTNYVYQHTDTISFLARVYNRLRLIRQYIIPIAIHSSWQYSERYFPDPFHNVKVDSVATIIVGGNSFKNSYFLNGVPGTPDDYFYIEEWVSDYTGVVRRYFNNRGLTTNPYQHNTKWALQSYHLE